MKPVKYIGRLAALVLLVATVMSIAVIPASADLPNGSLTISFPVDDTVYHLYRVGSLDTGDIVMDEAFSGVDSTDYAAAASAMAEMIKMTDVAEELASAVVTDGVAYFADLPAAVYLVVGDDCELDGIHYWPIPTLLSIPQKNEDDERIYDVTIVGKKDMDMEISAVKKWVGDNIIYRPSKVTVHLMLDGKPVGDPVTLDYTNNWTYTWTKLEPKNWYVTEDVNSRYTVTYSRNGNVFTIINTWKKLPQTGQLWWPVTAMTFAGVVFVCLGLIRRRKSEDRA